MVTVGIDLSADPAKTGVARIRWAGGRADVEEIKLNLSVPSLADEIEGADWTAIDSPFGWPDEFIRVIALWSRERRWEGKERAVLRYRLTDERVSETRYPLSVSSDRIGSTAMRCAELLHEVGQRRGAPVDRAGADKIIEVYPAAALKIWRPYFVDKYKRTGEQGKEKRTDLLASLAQQSAWLHLTEEQQALCIKTDHAIDALVCALMARAASRDGLTEPIPDDPAELQRAQREGWIHLPSPGSLDKLRS
jgi:predicted nuclease with RNAse H fold